MDVAGFCSLANVIVVAGKGGVGKTTVTSSLALAGARSGLNVLVVTLDDSAGVPRLFGHHGTLDYDPLDLTASFGASPLPGKVVARVITSDAALLEYLSDHGLGRVAKRLVNTGALDVVATAIPGIREVLVLGKLKQLELAKAADVILVDAPATGHAMTFLTSSGGLMNAARGGPLRSQAEQVVEMLADPKRCQVVLVTIPEETPVNELIETAFRVEDEIGVSLGPVIVNSCFPPLTHLRTDPARAARDAGVPAASKELLGHLKAAASFRAARQALQEEQLARLVEEMPLPQLRLPHLFSASLGPDELEVLAGALASGLEQL